MNRLGVNDFYNRVKKVKPVQGKDKCHMTQKPVELMQEFILLSSNEGDTILDPFAGSGTTAIACIKEKRHFIGFEISQKYVEIAEKRIKNETAQLTLF